MEQNNYTSSRLNSLHESREMNKISLDTFVFDKANNFDYSADRVITQLKAQNRESLKKYNALNKQLENYFDHDETFEINLMQEIHSHFLDIHYREDELFAFFEMKIIYAFKHVEINIKILLKAAYPKVSPNNFHKWEYFIRFLNSKSIEPTKLIGFEEVNQLRIVNNALKHSITIDERIRKILEFKNKSSFSYHDIELFYNRIKAFPNKFLASIAATIYNELYQFNDERLKNMAISVALRMDSATAKKFIEILKKCY